MNLSLRLYYFLKFILGRNIVNIKQSAEFKISNTASLKHVRIFVATGAKLEIADNVKITNAVIYVEKNSTCVINDACIIGEIASNTTNIIINNGTLNIDEHTKLSLKRIWIRFGGKCMIGMYTNINSSSEIRCDEEVSIGNYNQISHRVRIWDTNTHNIIAKDDRRKLTKEYYPYYGYETTKPKTSPVIIGDDCWIGEKASLLKGTKLGNEVIVGYNCLLTGQYIPDKTTVVSQSHINIIRRS